MKIIRDYSHGSSLLFNLVEALLAFWTDLSEFERAIKALWPSVDIYAGHTHRRYTLYGRDGNGRLQTETSIYLEL